MTVEAMRDDSGRSDLSVVQQTGSTISPSSLNVRARALARHDQRLSWG
jgi:hypothetical protein